MPFDFLMVKAYNVLNVEEIVPNYAAGTILLKGKGVGNTTKLVIDDRPVTTFLRISDDAVLVNWPYSVRNIIPLGNPSSGIQTASTVSYEWSGLKKTVGLHRLAQRFLHFLYRTPGSGFYSSELGAGLRHLFSQAVSSDYALSAVARAVSLAVQQVKDTQLTEWPDNEKLQGAEYSNFSYDSATGSIGMVLSLTAVDGSNARFYLG